ncbi:aminotransferase class IV [Corynebacterium deserti]|nr:aminotransferase class IV [Corynebacterium deserti]
MVDGKIRNLPGHIDRIIAAVPTAPQFLDRITSQLREAKGTVQARVSIEANHYNVELRPARLKKTLVTMDSRGHRDERRHPLVKGKDVAWQNKVTAESKFQGADDGLLVDESGRVIMAINSSLLAIQGDTVFHSTHPRAMLSVLEEPILTYLQEQGCHAKPRPDGFNIEDLRASEVWIIDSVDGARLVNAWVEYGTKFPVPEKRPVASFVPTYSEVNDYLWSTATPA